MSKLKHKSDFDRWYVSEFRKMTEDSAPTWIRERLNEALSIDRYEETFLRKIGKIRRLKKLTAIDPVNYICTVFRATSLKLNISVNYAFLYSSDMKYHNKIHNIKEPDNPVLIWYCVAPSLQSQDGEYRNRLIRFGQFDILVKKYAVIFEYIEKFLIDKVEKYELSLETEDFFPQIEHERLAETLSHRIVQTSLNMRFFIQFWLMEVYSLSVNLQENHINPKFNQIFFPHLDEDIKEFRAIKAKFGDEKVQDLIEMLSLPIYPSATAKLKLMKSYHSVGQKLRPLNVGEVQEPLNIKYAPWREIYLSGRAADLLVNTICPNFAIFVDWFYIKNAKKGLFDNEQQYQKLEFSDRSLVITRKLQETQRLTYTRDPKRDTKQFLNAAFEQVYQGIEDPIDFIKGNLLMSNVTLGFITENVGRTLTDIPSLQKSKEWLAVVGDYYKYETFKKYAFDFCYGVLALNKIGQTHSDAHLNNLTINNIDTAVNKAGSHAMYSVQGYWFAVPVRGPYGCLIDLSRGTIHPNMVKDYKYFANKEELNEFVDEQNARIIWKLENTIPTFMKLHGDKIRELMASHFDKFYQLYTAVDTFDIFSKISKYFDKKCDRDSIALANKIAKLSEHFLTTTMLKLLANPDLTIEAPVFQILKECFTDYIIDPLVEKKDMNIVDLWLYDKPMRYSLEEYERWPPILKRAHGMTDLTDPKSMYPLPEFDQMDQTRRDYEKYRKEQMKMVYYIARRHHEKYK